MWVTLPVQFNTKLHLEWLEGRGKKICYNYNHHLDNALICIVTEMECNQVGG